MKAAIIAFISTLCLVGLANLVPETIEYIRAGFCPPLNLILFIVLIFLFWGIAVWQVVINERL